MPFGEKAEGGLALPGTQTDSRGEKLEERPRFLSSLKREFSKETKILKKIKAFLRIKVHVEEAEYTWKKTRIPVKEHTGELRVSCTQ